MFDNSNSPYPDGAIPAMLWQVMRSDIAGGPGDSSLVMAIPENRRFYMCGLYWQAGSTGGQQTYGIKLIGIEALAPYEGGGANEMQFVINDTGTANTDIGLGFQRFPVPLRSVAGPDSLTFQMPWGGGQNPIVACGVWGYFL